MAAERVPSGLGRGGQSLWREVAAAFELDASQKVQLLEACRAKDRLDQLDAVLRGDVDTWLTLAPRKDSEILEVKVDAALSQANATANMLKQLLAALRLPDEASGKRPQRRSARGAYTPGGAKSANVSSLDRARAAKGGA